MNSQEVTHEARNIKEKEDSIFCPNCKTELLGQFCASCGQNQRRTDRFLFALIAEAFEDVFTFDSRASKTLFRLLFKPGALTKEYFKGRRARYVQPLRLYFITSLAFFFLLSLQSALSESEINLQLDDVIAEEADKVAKTDLSELTEEDKKGIRTSLDALSTSLNLGFFSEESKERLAKKIESQFEKARTMISEHPEEIIDEVLDLAPPVIFLLLPVFALLLKIVYINTGRYYTEHLILAVHNHSFVYITLLLSGLIKFLPSVLITELLGTLIVLWIPIYLFLSLRTTYEEGWFVSAIKYMVLGISYTMMFGFVSLIALVIGVLSL